MNGKVQSAIDFNHLVIRRMTYVGNNFDGCMVECYIRGPIMLADAYGDGPAIAIGDGLPVLIDVAALPTFLADAIQSLNNEADRVMSGADEQAEADARHIERLQEELTWEREQRQRAEQMIKQVDDVGWEGADLLPTVSLLASEYAWREAVARAEKLAYPPPPPANDSIFGEPLPALVQKDLPFTVLLVDDTLIGDLF